MSGNEGDLFIFCCTKFEIKPFLLNNLVDLFDLLMRTIVNCIYKLKIELRCAYWEAQFFL